MATTVVRVAVSNSSRQSSIAEQFNPRTRRHHRECCQHLTAQGNSRTSAPVVRPGNLRSSDCVCCAGCRGTLTRQREERSSCPLDSQATRLGSNLKKCLHKHLQNKLSPKGSRVQEERWSQSPETNEMGDIKRNGFARNGPIMTSSTEKREHLYKILVIGELGTGKTSFIKRYVHQFFSQNYRATIGVDFALKVLHWDSNTIVRLQLWDIAGQERFGNMTRVYYKEAVGAFIVFDVTRSGTFDCVSKWKEDLDSKVQLPDGSPIPCILLANKCDQDKQGIVTTPEKMDEYVRENGFAGWYETSAKENINIDEAARALVNKILLNDKLISAADIADSEKFNLSNSSNGGQSTTQSIKSKCSC